MDIDILSYELKYKNDRMVLDLLAAYKELLAEIQEMNEQIELHMKLQKLGDQVMEYFNSFDPLTEKQTLLPVLKYLKTECESVLSAKGIEKQKASKQKAELILSGAKRRLMGLWIVEDKNDLHA